MRSMQSAVAAVALAAGGHLWGSGRDAAAATGGAAKLGSVRYRATRERPYGWRGDQSGCFLGATPPTKWSRTPAGTFGGMTCQASRPKAAGRRGAGLISGAIRDWLLLGPFEVPDPAAGIEKPLIPNEAAATPDVGDRVGRLEWTPWRVSIDKQNPHYGGGAMALDFAVVHDKVEKLEWQNHPGTLEPLAAYAHAYLHSVSAGRIGLRVRAQGSVKAWLNGKPVRIPGQWDPTPAVEVAAGWNGLMVKCVSSKRAWNFTAELAPAPPIEYETRNFAWMARLPEWSLASPVIAGDRMFVLSEPCDVVCVRKADGKLLWIAGSSFYDALSPEERRALDPGLVKECDGIVAELKAANEKVVAAHNRLDWRSFNRPPYGSSALASAIRRKRELDKKLMDLMHRADRRKYYYPDKQRYGWTTPTPITDGERVYAAFSIGIVACHDVSGRREWVTLANEGGGQEHGSHSPPVIAGGSVVWMMNDLVTAFDAKTGRIVWKTRTRRRAHGGLNVARIGGQDLVLTAAGTILRASDGEIVWKKAPFALSWCTPVFDGRALYGCGGSDWKLSALLFPTPFDPERLTVKRLVPDATKYKNAPVASPLSVGGLLYSVDLKGILKVFRVADQSVVYEEPLADAAPRLGYVDPAGVCASPSLAGGNVYLLDNSGNWIIVKPGERFAQVARNQIVHLLDGRRQEQTIGTPVFEGGRIYYRGAEYLYCIGER